MQNSESKERKEKINGYPFCNFVSVGKVQTNKHLFQDLIMVSTCMWTATKTTCSHHYLKQHTGIMQRKEKQN